MQDRQVAEICQTNREILITINLECSKWVNLSAAETSHQLNTPLAVWLTPAFVVADTSTTI